MSDRFERRRQEIWRALGAACALVASVGLWAEPMVALVDRVSGVRPVLSSWAPGSFGVEPGFNARIETVPAGAEVRVDGEVRGETPFLGNIACRAGEPVEIKLSKKGFRPWIRNPICRDTGTLEVSAKLREAP